MIDFRSKKYSATGTGHTIEEAKADAKRQISEQKQLDDSINIFANLFIIFNGSLYGIFLLFWHSMIRPLVGIPLLVLYCSIFYLFILLGPWFIIPFCLASGVFFISNSEKISNFIKKLELQERFIISGFPKYLKIFIVTLTSFVPSILLITITYFNRAPSLTIQKFSDIFELGFLLLIIVAQIGILLNRNALGYTLKDYNIFGIQYPSSPKAEISSDSYPS